MEKKVGKLIQKTPDFRSGKHGGGSIMLYRFFTGKVTVALQGALCRNTEVNIKTSKDVSKWLKINKVKVLEWPS